DLARAVYSNRSLLLLDNVFSGLDNTTSKAVFQRLMGADGLLRKSRATVIPATNHEALVLTQATSQLLPRRRLRHHAAAGPRPPQPGPLRVRRSLRMGSPGQRLGHRHHRVRARRRGGGEEGAGPHKEVANPARKTEADLSRQTGDFDCYKIYLRSVGAGALSVLVVMSIARIAMNKMPPCARAILTKATEVWLRLWTEQGTGPRDLGYIGGYVGFALASTVTGTFNIGYFVVVGVPKSANRLHDILLNTVVRGVLIVSKASFYFFTSTDSGITLNRFVARFSQDMTLIDNALPMAFLNVAVLSLRALAETGLIASGASYVGAAIPICFVALYFVQKYSLRTSRQIRFLDLEMKSPLYTQFTETLAGLSTIRAFGWSGAFLCDNHARLDLAEALLHHFLHPALAAGGAGPVRRGHGARARRAGAAPARGDEQGLIEFNRTLTLVIDQWTRLETSLEAIARLKWFTNNIPDENREEEREEPASDWPAPGAI
ncbi:ABC transporter, transmembrane domain, type 1, partial [Tolypocladium paradoxum]